MKKNSIIAPYLLCLIVYVLEFLFFREAGLYIVGGSIAALCHVINIKAATPILIVWCTLVIFSFLFVLFTKGQWVTILICGVLLFFIDGIVVNYRHDILLNNSEIIPFLLRCALLTIMIWWCTRIKNNR